MVPALITRQQRDGVVGFPVKPAEKGKLIATIEKTASHHNLTGVSA